jgi:hypothetical protein
MGMVRVVCFHTRALKVVAPPVSIKDHVGWALRNKH